MNYLEKLIQGASAMYDPRVNRTKKYTLVEIIIISLYAVICGARNWEQVELIGKKRKNEIEKYIEIPHGIPSHDTFNRVFKRIIPSELEKVLTDWFLEIKESFVGEVVAIDGKTLRHSFDNALKTSAIHSISAFCVQGSVVLRQVFGSNKESEITQDVELLKLLDLSGAIVTIDAIGCQLKIVEQIVLNNKAHYLIGCKNNQPVLYNNVQQLLENSVRTLPEDIYQESDGGHGRTELRSCICMDVTSLKDELFPTWTGLATIAKVTTIRETAKGQSTGVRYFISSLPCKAKTILSVVRSHWSIENKLHYVMDVTFFEDASRIRKLHGPANFSIFRRIALALIKRNSTDKKIRSCSMARLAALIDPEYAIQILLGS